MAGPRTFRTTTSHLTSANIHDHLSATIPAGLRSRYKWGFRNEFITPYGIVHLKAKKQWQKGHTIISYFHSLSGNLLRITSRALDIILQHLFPQHPGQLSIPQLWRHFHCYLTQTPTDINLHATNDDLVGFFSSVPQHRLIDAVHSMIQQWQSQHSTHTHTLTVDAKATGNPFHHSHVGRHYTKHPTQRTLHTSDITTIVAFAPEHLYFPGMQQHIQANSRGWDWLPTLSCPLQRCHHLDRALLAPAPQQPSSAHSPPFLLLQVCRQPFHRTQRTLPLPSSHSDSHPPQLLWRSRRTTFTSWASTSTFRNAQSPTSNPTNPGKSGIPPAPALGSLRLSFTSTCNIHIQLSTNHSNGSS